MTEQFGNASRFSLNQITVPSWSIRELAAACNQRGVDKVGLWRHKVHETGVAETARILRDSGISVTSLCRGGMFPATTKSERATRIDDNLRAIEEAVALETQALTLVCGPAEGQPLSVARRQVRDGIEAIVENAQAAGVRLGIEPLHPMMVEDRSVILTLSEANDLSEQFDETVGVTLDAYHIFWDSELYSQVLRAASGIVSFQISDWVIPIEGQLTSRGMPGDGCIALRDLARVVHEAGYRGPIEVEILSSYWWDVEPNEVFDLAMKRFSSCLR